MPRAKDRKRIELTVPSGLYDQIQVDAAAAGVSATEWLLTGRGYSTRPRYRFPTGAANPSAQAAKEDEVECPKLRNSARLLNHYLATLQIK